MIMFKQTLSQIRNVWLDGEEWLVGILLLLEWVVASLLSDDTSSIRVAIPKQQGVSITKINLNGNKVYRSCPTFPNVSCPPSRFSSKPASLACSWSTLVGCLPVLGAWEAPLGGRGDGEEDDGEVKDGADELAYVPWRLNDGAEDIAGDAVLDWGKKEGMGGGADDAGAKGLLEPNPVGWGCNCCCCICCCCWNWTICCRIHSSCWAWSWAWAWAACCCAIHSCCCRWNSACIASCWACCWYGLNEVNCGCIWVNCGWRPVAYGVGSMNGKGLLFGISTWLWSSKSAEALESSTAFLRRASSSSLNLIACCRSRSSVDKAPCFACSSARDRLLSSIALLNSSSSLSFPLPFGGGPRLLLELLSSSSTGDAPPARIILSRICARDRLSSRNRPSSWSKLVMSLAFCRTLAPWSFPSSSVYWNSFNVLMM